MTLEEYFECYTKIVPFIITKVNVFLALANAVFQILRMTIADPVFYPTINLVQIATWVSILMPLVSTYYYYRKIKSINNQEKRSTP